MLKDKVINAQAALTQVLFEYENNGIRYEPSDREDLINMIIQFAELGNRLSNYMDRLPFLDSHPIGTPIPEATPSGVETLFDELDQTKFISPEGPLMKHRAYDQLKGIFRHTALSIAEAYHLLRPQKSNN